jgi:biopolymer transport protein TolR
MAMNGGTAAVAGRRRHRRRPVMAEINVTPMVDVMLVLLIIFMVSAPLMTVGIEVRLPQSRAKSLTQDKEPLVVTVDVQGQIFLQDSQLNIDELVTKLKAILEARGGMSEAIVFRGDKDLRYGVAMRVLGRLNEAGFSNVALITDIEQPN